MNRTDPQPPPPRARRRARVTSARVIWVDRAAAVTVTLGGLLVILAVLGILAYLIVVVQPLFAGASLAREAGYRLLPGDAPGVLFAELDEYRSVGICGLASGEILTFAARTGDVVGRASLFPSDRTVTSVSRTPSGGHTALAFADGSVLLARIDFKTEFLGLAPVEEDSGDATRVIPGGLIERLASGQIRRVTTTLEVEPPFSLGTSGAPVMLMDYRVADDQTRLAALTSTGELLLRESLQRRNFLTGEATPEVAITAVPLPKELSALGAPSFLLLTTVGDQLYLAWPAGELVRYDLRDPAVPLLAERLDMAPEPDARLTALSFVSGEQSILASDSRGRTRAWFRLPRLGAGADGHAMVVAHTLAAHSAGVTAITGSQRAKSLLTGAADGSLILHHLTSERVLARERLDPAAAVVWAQITPKGDGIFALGANGQATLWRLRAPHPETSLSSLFGRVWYEGYPEPGYTWQSSSATDEFEPKLSLVPLIFGTLKATLYSMLFAVPIALGAAIYTSEFLDPRYRAPVKSTIEMMASLPSVVLGFLAALVLAPIVESWVLAVLAAFALVPLSALGAGYLCQMLPARAGLRLSGRAQLLVVILISTGSLWAARAAAGPIESALFGGDFKGWLDGRTGTGAPGLGLLAWPAILIGLLVLDRKYIAEALGRRRGSTGPRRAAAVELGRFLAILILSMALAWALAVAGAALGLDPRGELFGTYIQRNALVVGFVMGFAVVPIIYTIAEDALSAVPQSLRSASLGCGATRWQTATRVVLPVALSGIFSALMVGLGRAVGETMIVLMAAGNTPLIDFNVFNGLRTLSANIAVELPEAAKDGTLYRVLFLAALMLFLITFVVNTLAEIIRQRFRRRAYQL